MKSENVVTNGKIVSVNYIVSDMDDALEFLQEVVENRREVSYPFKFTWDDYRGPYSIKISSAQQLTVMLYMAYRASAALSDMQERYEEELAGEDW